MAPRLAKERTMIKGPVAFLFPGQGAHHVGMMKRLLRFPEVSRLVSIANDICNYDMLKLTEYGPENLLNQTQFTQPAIFLTSMAYWTAVAQHRYYVDDSSLFMGHSIGEYAALAACSAVSFEDAMSLVVKRGKYMNECVSAEETSMTALSLQTYIDSFLSFYDDNSGDLQIDISAINSPSQIVLSGLRRDLDSFASRCRPLVKRSVPLKNVSRPFHSRFMLGAKLRMTSELQKINLRPSRGVYIPNVSGFPTGTGDLRSLLSNQITSTVQWKKSIDYALSIPDISFVEVGPGTVLKNLLRDFRRDTPVVSISA